MFSVVTENHMDLHPETHYLTGSKIPSQLAGIDTGTFKAHSCRAAATSEADSKGLPLKHNHDGWTVVEENNLLSVLLQDDRDG